MPKEQEIENLLEELRAAYDLPIYGTSFIEVTYDVERDCIVKKRIDPTTIRISND